MKPEKTCVIACGVFRSDLEILLEGTDHPPEVEYLPGGLHSEPDRLRTEVQERIDAMSPRFERIIVLYGLCGRGVVGLRSGTATLVLPRVHDCISLFLGGAEEYRRQFAHAPGTYYISAGWYEEQIQPRGANPFAGGRKTCTDCSEKNAEQTVGFPVQYVDTADPDELAGRYGSENADEITDFLQSWKKNYTRAVYIDTGGAEEEKYEAHARNLADENGWEYLKLKGNRRLISKSLEAGETDSDILIVPPGHEIILDASSGTADSAPVGQGVSLDRNETWMMTGTADGSAAGTVPRRDIGLGIDAGGTYTDAVIYEFGSRRVLAKAKSLTTKWKYSTGIMGAVGRLPKEFLGRVDLVSVSTTLVTNAVVESAGRPVGLLLMPNGEKAPADLRHGAMKVIGGRMTIGGEVTRDVDRDEVIAAARELVSRYHVEAFAVSGYGGAVNPELERTVKDIVRNEFGMEACCGHELSGSLNFSIRAATAALNAGVMPIMEEFLAEMESSMESIGIRAPLMVVRGDGSVMSEAYARQYPVQTALSGPAASMAGARFLTGLDEALVADVGGTTSDIGFLEEGRVAVCDDGARIGDWDTHVRAVDMLTVGLGGDSEILFERQEWSLGPRRIEPVCALEGVTDSILTAMEHADHWSESILPLQFLRRTGKEPPFELTSREKAIYDILEDGPLMVHEIRDRIDAGSWRLIRTGRLEASYCLQRAGLTPTDIFHAGGELDFWNAGTARSYLALTAAAAGSDAARIEGHIRDTVKTRLGGVLLKKLLGTTETPGSGRRNGAAPSQDFNEILKHGNSRISISPRIEIPVIGLGAPASLMCSEAVANLGGKLLLPAEGDVANAVGAIASEIRVVREASVAATSAGGFRISGLDGEDRHYEELDEAEERCINALADDARRHARRAGTSASEVQMSVSTDLASSADGSELFIARHYRAVLEGAPDLI